ncbi:MAG: molecular chaperone TorD family protein [Alphaproteobacteria bacterium]
MRDAGLSAAIQAAGSIGELARRLGISQPSVSNWSRIPAERVLAVEAATGVDRSLLRPDLHPAEAPAPVDEIDAARAREYALLAALLARAPDLDLLRRLRMLRSDGSAIGDAHGALAAAAAEADPATVEREHFDLFVGLGRGELMPYGSYYLTGFLHERPLARLRGDLAALGIASADGNPEPEDHAAILCEIMAGLAGGRFPAPAGSDQRIFARHLAPWIGRFFQDLEKAERARFYRAVGALGRTFVEIESEAFTLAA